MVLGYYRIDIATALLYSHVLHSTDARTDSQDFQRLSGLYNCVCSITHGCQELAPIRRAMETLNKMVNDLDIAT